MGIAQHPDTSQMINARSQSEIYTQNPAPEFTNPRIELLIVVSNGTSANLMHTPKYTAFTFVELDSSNAGNYVDLVEAIEQFVLPIKAESQLYLNIQLNTNNLVLPAYNDRFVVPAAHYHNSHAIVGELDTTVGYVDISTLIKDYSSLQPDEQHFSENIKPTTKVGTLPFARDSIQTRIEYTNKQSPDTDLTTDFNFSSVTQDASQLGLLSESTLGFNLETYLQSSSRANTVDLSNSLFLFEQSTTSYYEDHTSEKPSEFSYIASLSLAGADQNKKRVEPLESRLRQTPCYAKPELKYFAGFEETNKKDDYLENKKAKSYCPVIVHLRGIEAVSFEKRKVEPLKDKVELSLCPVKPNLRERFYVDANTQVKWFSLFDAPVDITLELLLNNSDYTVRVKGKDIDFERPFYESRSVSYVAKANSGVAIVDRLVRQLGLNPVWEIDQEITDDNEIRSGKVYLKDIMGVRDATKSQEVDYVVRFFDKHTGKVELKALEDIISMGDINSKRYTLDVVVQARTIDELPKQIMRFKERIDLGYKMPVLEKVSYRENLERLEPLSGTGGIDEFLPESGDIYDIVIASQGVYDRNSKNITGAYSILKFRISDKDITDNSDYVMMVKDKNGFEKQYRTKANTLAAIIDRKLEEYGLKGVFIEIATHKDGEGTNYQTGGELNNTTIYLAGVQGAMTEFLRTDPNANLHQMGILVEKLVYPCGGKDFDRYHNLQAYNQRRMEKLNKAA